MPRSESLGAWLRQLRKTRRLPLRTVAGAAEIDTTLLSKIELGQRLPTEPQTRALAAFFGRPPEDLEAKRIAERFWNEHKGNPVAPKAVKLLRARAPTNVRNYERHHSSERRTPAGNGHAIT